MRIVAILANLTLLGFVAMLIVKQGLPSGGDVGIFAAIVAAPVVSIIALVRNHDWPFPELISLELQARKAKLRQQIAEAQAKAATARDDLRR